MQRTLGKPHTNLTHEAILDSVDKLVKLHKGEIEPDDRDAMQYQKAMGPEDLFAAGFGSPASSWPSISGS